MSDDLAYADEPMTGMDNLDVTGRLDLAVFALATLAHPEATAPADLDALTPERLDAAATILATLAGLLRDGTLVLTPPTPVCGADFMAGTECDLPPDHGGPHLATYLL